MGKRLENNERCCCTMGPPLSSHHPRRRLVFTIRKITYLSAESFPPKVSGHQSPFFFQSEKHLVFFRNNCGLAQWFVEVIKVVAVQKKFNFSIKKKFVQDVISAATFFFTKIFCAHNLITSMVNATKIELYLSGLG